MNSPTTRQLFALLIGIGVFVTILAGLAAVGHYFGARWFWATWIAGALVTPFLIWLMFRRG
jgi:hypothetical protein